jgi:hypothetical protein
MAFSWITTPYLRPSSDTTSSEYHPGLLAHKRAGPFEISAAQICVKIGKDGQPSLPSDVVLDERYTHYPPPFVTFQVKDGPPAPSDVHTNVFTTSPLLKHKQVARPQSPSSSSTFERQVLASIPTTNSQSVAPISAASNPTPLLSPSSPDALPISTTDISTTGSPTIVYSQLATPTPLVTLTQYPDPGRSQPTRRPPKRAGTIGGTGGTGVSGQTQYTDMIFEEIPFRFNVMTFVFMWIVLAGFLVLPSSFPKIQTILGDSNKLCRVVRVARNIPLYVAFFLLVPLFKEKRGFCGSFVHSRLTCGIKSTDLSSASPAAALARSGCFASGGAGHITISGFSPVSSSQGCSLASLAWSRRS